MEYVAEYKMHIFAGKVCGLHPCLHTVALKRISRTDFSICSLKVDYLESIFGIKIQHIIDLIILNFLFH